MKNISLFRFIWAAGIAVTLTASASVQAQVSENVAISLVGLESGATNDNGTTTTIRTPARLVLTTRELLRHLAADENRAGHYDATNFPAGAVLTYNGTFSVHDRKGNLLVDVSDVLTLSFGQQIIRWGNGRDTGGAPFSHASRQLVTLNYDSTGSGGTTKFSVTGMGSFADVAGRPNSRGNAREVASFRASVVGEGVDSSGAGVVLSGGIEAAGAATLSTAQ
ncbi:MAG TPA: hypothetical protein VHB20_14130 [Verrucomicrobiae bacterium]|jgi:hypothetical protein|nr:hypothetical protein [Verrucomicrobiae bacterium]